MKTYYLDLVGLRVVLHTPEPITIGDNLRPFLCQPHPMWDFVITVQYRDALPETAEGGIWRGPEYFDYGQGNLRIFHCHVPGGDAFALTCFDETGNVQMDVLPAFAGCVSGSEGILNRIGLETLLLQQDTLLLHASWIIYNGKGIAFAGPSGVGKSTQAQFWQDLMQAKVANGDRAALRKIGQQWLAYGSPYAGTSGIYENLSAPLQAVVLLEQGDRNCLERLSAVQALSGIYPELSIHRWDRNFAEKATDLCLQLLADVPVYRLSCKPEEAAVLLLKKGLLL